ncbi:MAG: PQQ-dependent sugar dehydrogenase [Myxococcota bacterium]
MDRRLSILGIVCALLCGCSEGGAPGATVSDVFAPTGADDVFVPDDTRTPNLTCLAPSPPPPPGDIQLLPAFGDYLPSDGLDRVIQLVQDPVDDDHWFLVNQRGPIQRFGPDHTSPMPVLDLTDKIFTGHHEAGTIDLVFHPDFETNRYAYVIYSAKGGSWQFDSRLSRFDVATDMTLDPDSELILFVEPQGDGSHSLNHAVFGPDGMLYLASGDGGNGSGQPNGQDTSNTKGAILRIDVNQAQPPRAYGIPGDNPFVDGGGAPEIWAYGFRNVWRFSFDAETGQLWAGDVGQNTHEEINLVEGGGNYGWAVMEGDLCFGANDLACDHDGMIDPVVSIDHVEGVSVTGGFVYRGTEISAIVGRLVYADFGSGNIWTLEPETGVVELQLESGVGIASFAEGRDKTLYVVGYSANGMGNVYEIVSNDVGPSEFPEHLSETGCVDMAQPSQAVEGVHPYSVQVQLWSDGAEKERFVALPDERRVDVADNGDFHWPPGAVFIKHFKYGDRYHETRLLMRHEDGDWAGYSYEWNEAQTDATLLTVGKTKELADGHQWRYPTRGQCLRCHGEQSYRALGPEVVQLQHPDPSSPSGALTILERWFEQGFFVPEFESVDALPGMQLSPLPRLTSDASLEDRARAYLHVNCANCHQPDGIGQGVIDFRWETDFADMGICNEKPEEGQMWLSGEYWLLAPGDPQHSLMYLRMETLNKFRMPDLASHVVDEEGLAIIGDWISSLTECP